MNVTADPPDRSPTSTPNGSPWASSRARPSPRPPSAARRSASLLAAPARRARTFPATSARPRRCSAPAGLAAGAVLVFGLGPRETFEAGAAFAAGVAVARRLSGKTARDRGRRPARSAGDPAAVASALTEGLVVGTRGPGLRKTEPARHPFETLQIVVPPGAGRRGRPRAVRRGAIVGEAVNLARDLANTPPAEKAPTAPGRAGARGGGRGRARASRSGTRRGSSGSGSAGCSASPPGRTSRPRSSSSTTAGGGDAPDARPGRQGGDVRLRRASRSSRRASMEDMKSDMTGAAVVLATMQRRGPARAAGQPRRLPGP